MNNEKRTILRTTRALIQTQIATLTKTALDTDSADDDALKVLWAETEGPGSQLDDIYETLSAHQEEEQSKFDDLSEGLRNSDMGQGIEQAAQQLEYAYDAVQQAINDLATFTVTPDTTATDIAEAIQSVIDDCLEEAIVNINDAIGD